jgi:hypothetical protein
MKSKCSNLRYWFYTCLRCLEHEFFFTILNPWNLHIAPIFTWQRLCSKWRKERTHIERISTICYCQVKAQFLVLRS